MKTVSLSFLYWIVTVIYFVLETKYEKILRNCKLQTQQTPSGMNNLLYWELLRDANTPTVNLEDVIERIQKQEYDDVFNVEKWYRNRQKTWVTEKVQISRIINIPNGDS
jgi:predicted Zn-dependent peptidase